MDLTDEQWAVLEPLIGELTWCHERKRRSFLQERGMSALFTLCRGVRFDGDESS